MQKLAVLGNPGGGKSTLSRRWSAELGVPYFSVDAAIWRLETGKVPGEEVERIHHQWLAQPGWIIDGWGDFNLITKRLEEADTVILIEHPMWRHYWWAARRECGNVVRRTREGQSPGEVLDQTWQLIKAIRWVRRTGLPWLMEELERQHAGGKLLRITGREALDALMENPHAALSAPKREPTPYTRHRPTRSAPTRHPPTPCAPRAPVSRATTRGPQTQATRGADPPRA